MPPVLWYSENMKELRELWPGGVKYAGDAVGVDSLALADFAAGVDASRCCDLGCGSGILLLLLAREKPELSVDGVELRPAAAEECRENIRANAMEGRCRVETADWRCHTLAPGCMDLVVSNPPYFPAGRGRPSPDADRALMRVESATLPELCRTAAALLRRGGSFCLVHRVSRMAEVFSALEKSALTPRRLRLFSDRRGHAPSLFFCQALSASPGELCFEPTLYQFGDDGAETAEYRRICHWEN